MITATINARLHDEARVASVKFSLSNISDLSSLCSQISEQLRITVNWAEEKDVLIGHVKAYLQWGAEEAAMLSTTGDTVQIKGSVIPEHYQGDPEVGITAIVFGVDLEEAEERLEGMAASIIGQNGEWAEFCHECEHHHHHEDCECGREHHHHDDCECGHVHHHHEDCECGHEHHHHAHIHDQEK